MTKLNSHSGKKEKNNMLKSSMQQQPQEHLVILKSAAKLPDVPNAYNTMITQEIMIKHIASELLTTLLDASGFSNSRFSSSILLLPCIRPQQFRSLPCFCSSAQLLLTSQVPTQFSCHACRAGISQVTLRQCYWKNGVA